MEPLCVVDALKPVLHIFGFRSLVFRYFPVSHVCSSNMDDENDKLEEDFYQFLNLARDVSIFCCCQPISLQTLCEESKHVHTSLNVTATFFGHVM